MAKGVRVTGKQLPARALLLLLLFPPLAIALPSDQTSAAVQPSRRLVADLTHQAQEDFQNGRYTEARATLRKALNLVPRDPDLWTYLGLTDEQLNDLDAAIGDFRKVLSFLPGDPQACFNLGRLYRRKGDSAHAIELYQQGLKSAPNDLPANQNYALLLMDTGKFREAIVPLRKMRSLDGSDLPTRAALIECFLKAAMLEDGKREIEEFLKMPNVSPDEKLKLAKLLMEDKLPEFALPILQQVVEALPDSAEAHGKLGLLLMNAGQYEAASNEFNMAVQLDPKSAEYSMHLVDTLLLDKRFQEALDFLKAVKGEFGNLYEYRFKMGLVLYGARQYPQAISLFADLDRERPNLDLIQYYLGNSYRESGEAAKAEAYYRKAISLNPNQSTYYSGLAQVLRKQGGAHTDEAIASLKKALALDPSDSSSKQELALCFETKRDYSQAERLLREVIAQQPEIVSAHLDLSRVYYEDHKKDEGDAEKKAAAQLGAQ